MNHAPQTMRLVQRVETSKGQVVDIETGGIIVEGDVTFPQKVIHRVLDVQQ